MIRKLISSLQKPYPLNIDFNRVLPFILAFGFFISIFLIIFQPFGLNNYHSPDKTLQLIGMGFIVTILLSVNLLAIPKIISSVFSEDRWNIGREITWNIWLSVTTILGSSFYWVLVTGQTVSAAYIYRASLNSLVFTLFLTPISVLCVMSNYMRSLKRKLERAEEVTRSLQSSQTKSFTHPLELLSETGKEKLKMPVDKLLFIQSCDNYANVVRQKNGSTTEKLLRSSLKNIEEQITLPFIVRCHRSFIVNLSLVRAITGNSRNYTLSLKNYPTPIPVSRESEKQVLELLEKLSN
ncbi:MAG: LytTR family transcriptional regulator [Caldithrix sp.]|nr:MAG: LytTR family transcriptional regulator [Caldithrix sp.]